MSSPAYSIVNQSKKNSRKSNFKLECCLHSVSLIAQILTLLFEVNINLETHKLLLHMAMNIYRFSLVLRLFFNLRNIFYLFLMSQTRHFVSQLFYLFAKISTVQMKLEEPEKLRNKCGQNYDSFTTKKVLIQLVPGFRCFSIPIKFLSSALVFTRKECHDTDS